MLGKKSRFFAATISAAIFLALTQLAVAQYSVIYDFAGAAGNGITPTGALVQDESGNLYGTTSSGGPFGFGTIFEIGPGGGETTLYSFTGGNDGGVPVSGLFRDPAGNLYGVTNVGGNVGCECGVAFKLDTSNVLTVLHNFSDNPDGSNPRTRFVSIDGVLYGTTENGGTSENGTLFSLTKGGKETVLYSFASSVSGALPQALTRDSAGNLYGVTPVANGQFTGTVFEFDAAGTFSVLHTFSGTDGLEPMGRLIRDVSGNITGTTQYGGNLACASNQLQGCGNVFRLDTAGNLTTLHNFFDGGGGHSPAAGVVDIGGTLYGTTYLGGDPSCACGVLYQIGKTGQYTVLHRFTGGADGAFPQGELTVGNDGSIYGSTASNGNGVDCSDGCGTIFKYTP